LAEQQDVLKHEQTFNYEMHAG